MRDNAERGARPEFSMERVAATMEKYGMLEGARAVLVGVSGGCDSTSLLHILSFLAPRFGFELAAAHVNHHLRGRESDRDRDFVVSMCREYGVPLRVLEADVAGAAAERRVSLEQAGRDIRYGFFESAAAEMGPGTRIATAHTLSDSAETFLFNMARGTTIAGLCGIPPVRGDVIRPLIETTRQELEKFCDESGIAYVTDSTNLTDDYARNRLRHNAVPALLEVNPSFERAFARLTESLSQDRDYLDRAAADALERAALPDGSWDGHALAGEHPAIKMRAAAALLEKFGFECDYARTAWICERLGAEDFKTELARDRYFTQKDGAVFAEEKEAPPREFAERPLLPGKNEVFPGKTLEIRRLERKNGEISEKIHECILKNMLDSDRIKGSLIFRPRREGDKINLGGATRTLKKLFSEAGVPLHLRGEAVVIADDGGPVWVEGFGAAKRAKAGPDTGSALLIELTEKDASEGVTK